MRSERWISVSDSFLTLNPRSFVAALTGCRAPRLESLGSSVTWLPSWNSSAPHSLIWKWEYLCVTLHHVLGRRPREDCLKGSCSSPGKARSHQWACTAVTLTTTTHNSWQAFLWAFLYVFLNIDKTNAWQGWKYGSGGRVLILYAQSPGLNTQHLVSRHGIILALRMIRSTKSSWAT